MRIRYEGTVAGFRRYALPALRRAAMAGLCLQDDSPRLQRCLRRAMVKDLAAQILNGGRVA